MFTSSVETTACVRAAANLLPCWLKRISRTAVARVVGQPGRSAELYAVGGRVAQTSSRHGDDEHGMALRVDPCPLRPSLLSVSID